ncbi:MAG: M48 family metalloprotease [Proteobacteria bacterium]|nr:M48 family metalloprotease [Pseudomonadota bacterium]
MRKISIFYLLLILGFVTGCAKNPVTGATELHFVSESQEIKLGEKNYLYGQQAGGGQYAIDPELTAYVNEVGSKLVKVSDRKDLPFEFVVLNSSVPNAWALPGGKIAVNRGLLVHLDNEAELAAVLGHEITHAAARHGAKSMERQILISTGLAATNVALATKAKESTAAKVTTGAIGAGAGVAANLVSTKYGREAELEADSYGMNYMVKAGYDPNAAVSLQKTFVRLFDNKSPNWLEGLFASHPPSQERADANLQRALTMPKGLTLGKERYQQKIAKLKNRESAYSAYDDGVKALAKGDLNNALSLTEKAILQEPNEALFYGLKGDILSKQDQKEKALAAYQQAITYDKNYFYYYHQRGLLLEGMGRKMDAKADLERSQQLMPTEEIANHLKALG